MPGMTSDQYARLKDIVAGALSERDEHRSAYLRARCGADATLLLEAEAWLVAAVEDPAEIFPLDN